jgi:hypothetical protein
LELDSAILALELQEVDFAKRAGDRHSLPLPNYWPFLVHLGYLQMLSLESDIPIAESRLGQSGNSSCHR